MFTSGIQTKQLIKHSSLENESRYVIRHTQALQIFCTGAGVTVGKCMRGFCFFFCVCFFVVFFFFFLFVFFFFFAI